MPAVTLENLKAKVAILNRTFGYKNPPQYKKLKSGKFKAVGKGFQLYSAYGKVQLTWSNYAKNTGQTDISGFMSKRDLADCISAIRKAYEMKARR